MSITTTEPFIPSITHDVLQHYMELAPGAPAAVFCVSVEHAKMMAAALTSSGTPAEMIWARTPPAERAAILRRFEKRETLMICGTPLLMRGLDIKAAVSIIMSFTRSPAMFADQISKADLVIDMVGNALRCGVPDDFKGRILAPAWSIKPEERT